MNEGLVPEPALVHRLMARLRVQARATMQEQT